MSECHALMVWIVSYMSRPDGECMQHNQRAFSSYTKAIDFIAEMCDKADDITIIQLKVE